MAVQSRPPSRPRSANQSPSRGASAISSRKAQSVAESEGPGASLPKTFQSWAGRRYDAEGVCINDPENRVLCDSTKLNSGWTLDNPSKSRPTTAPARRFSNSCNTESVRLSLNNSQRSTATSGASSHTLADLTLLSSAEIGSFALRGGESVIDPDYEDSRDAALFRNSDLRNMQSVGPRVLDREHRMTRHGQSARSYSPSATKNFLLSSSARQGYRLNASPTGNPAVRKLDGYFHRGNHGITSQGWCNNNPNYGVDMYGLSLSVAEKVKIAIEGPPTAWETYLEDHEIRTYRNNHSLDRASGVGSISSDGCHPAGARRPSSRSRTSPVKRLEDLQTDDAHAFRRKVRGSRSERACERPRTAVSGASSNSNTSKGRRAAPLTDEERRLLQLITTHRGKPSGLR